MREIGGARQVKALDKGPYRTDPTIEIEARYRNLKKVPIGRFAVRLTVDYLRRSAFWYAVKDDESMPLEIAAEAYLHVKETQAREILKELEAAGGPEAWFRTKAQLGFQTRAIPLGAATKGSAVADEFYYRIAGDAVVLAYEQAVSGRRRITAGELIEGLKFLQVQCMLYRAVNRPSSLRGAHRG